MRDFWPNMYLFTYFYAYLTNTLHINTYMFEHTYL